MEEALQDTVFRDDNFMRRTGIHVTWRTAAKTVKQMAFGYSCPATPWGTVLRCANETCTGTYTDVQPRIHKKYSGAERVRFSCNACNMRTEYIPRPSWLHIVDAANRIVMYPMFVDGRPIDESLIGKYPMFSNRGEAAADDVMNIE